MSAWGNTDGSNQKPKFDFERQTRETILLNLFSATVVNSNTIQLAYNDGGQNNVANIGVSTGQFVYVAGQGKNVSALSANGYPGFFAGNNSVVSISGNTVTLSSNAVAVIPAGSMVEFDKPLVFNSNKPSEVNYNKDTVLVTPTRMANNTVTMGDLNAGWVKVTRKVNNDGSVRYMNETLVALANPVASNTSSGNTSWGQAFTGL